MTHVEIIMQQKRIAAEKEKAEKKLAYDTIKEYAENNAEKFVENKINLISKKFINDDIDKVVYNCVFGKCNYPLGNDYPESLGAGWKVNYYKNGRSIDERNLSSMCFFDSHPIVKSEYNIELLQCFISHLAWETRLPERLKEEGFIVDVRGRGCCQTITVTLPPL